MEERMILGATSILSHQHSVDASCVYFVASPAMLGILQVEIIMMVSCYCYPNLVLVVLDGGGVRFYPLALRLPTLERGLETHLSNNDDDVIICWMASLTHVRNVTSSSVTHPCSGVKDPSIALTKNWRN